jgi:hypothetical protein
MRQRRETVELGTTKARMGRGIRPSAAQNVAAFDAGVSVLGLICALLRIRRNAFQYAGITRAIVMLAARADRFLEISVGLLPTASGPSQNQRQPEVKYRNATVLSYDLFAAVHESAFGT